MPLGENVGRAYVSIYADGTSIPDDIRDSLEKAEPVVRGEGEEHGKTYDKHFEKGLDKEGHIAKSLQQQLEKGVADADLADNFFHGQHWENFRDSVEEEFGLAGRNAADELAQEFTRRGSLKGIENEMRTMTNRVADYIKRAGEEELKFATNAFREVADQQERIHREQEADWERHVKNLERNVGRVTDQYDQIADAVERMEAGEKSSRGSRSELIRDLGHLQGIMRSAGGATDEWELKIHNLEKRLIHLHPTLTRASTGIHTLGDRLGKAFGKGSRNDFVNIIGGMTGGLVHLVALVPDAIAKFSDFGRSVKYAFDESFRDSGSVFRATAASIGTAVESIGTAIVGLGVVAAGAIFIIGPLIGIISTLAGVVTALAAAISFALIGALGAVVGALVPLVGGLGFAVAGFLSLDKAQKKVLSNDFKPVVNQFKSLGKEVAKGMIAKAGEQADRLAAILRNFHPLARQMGLAISDVGDSFLHVLEGPGFTQFTDALTKFLPDATRKLGTALSHAFGGFTGLLESTFPITNTFLDWLVKITKQFDKWANSNKGQKALINFFDRAKDSAKSLGGVLDGVRDVLVNLADQGQKPGNNMLDQLSDGLHNIGDYLEAHPDAFAQWFGDSEKTFADLGDSLRGLADAFDTLDTSASRAQGSGLFKILGFLATVSANGIFLASEGIYALAGALRELGEAIGWAAGNTFDSIVDIITGDWGDLGSTLGEGIDFSGFWDGLKSSALGAAKSVGHILTSAFSSIKIPKGNLGGGLQVINPGEIARQITKAVQIIGTLPGRANGAVIGIAGKIASNFAPLAGQVGSHISSAVGRIVTLMSQVPGKVGHALAGVPAAIFGPFEAAVGRVAGIPGQIVSAFSGLAGRILSAIGSIDIGSLIHIPSPGAGVPFVPGIATGGYFGGTGNKPLLRWVMEDGPEAIVPLNRPLDQVDPSVRALSAIAQGKAGVMGGGKRVDVGGIVVQSNAEDPEAVALSVVNRLVAAAY